MIPPASEVRLISQYRDAPKLQALVDNLTDIVDSTVADVLHALSINPDSVSGILLDWIGSRVGISRPSVASADAEYWGFEGTASDAGKPWNQAPYFTREQGIEQVEPVGDRVYRLLIKARARGLRGGANRETVESVMAILFGNGYVTEGENEVVVSTTDEVLYRLVSGRLFDLLIPRPAGVSLSIRRV